MAVYKTTKNKKLGLVTWIGSGNYGTSLQSFALYKVVQSMGYECYYINPFDYKNFSLRLYVKYMLIYLGFRRIKRKIIFARNKKMAMILNFQKENIKQKDIKTKGQYNRLLEDINVYIAGSDQIWNSYFYLSTFMLLDFAGKNKRISYASSIGTNDIPEKNKDIFKEHLMKFSHISLREEIGVKAVSQLLNRSNIKKVLDPTFLLTPSEWKSISRSVKLKIDLSFDYVLCYLIGQNENYFNQIADLLEKLKIDKLIIIPAAENKYFDYSEAIIYKDAGPKEFVQLIEKAKMVCTDSFHATAISINMSKDFVEFIRFNKDNEESQNSRIYDLLNHFGLNDRIYIQNSNKWIESIDYTKVQLILSDDRKESLNYLVDAIEN